MKNLASPSLLRGKMIILPNSHYLTYTFFSKGLGECILSNLGVKGLNLIPVTWLIQLAPCSAVLNFFCSLASLPWPRPFYSQEWAISTISPYNKYYTTQHKEGGFSSLTKMKDDYTPILITLLPILTTLLARKSGRCTVLSERGSERFNPDPRRR